LRRKFEEIEEEIEEFEEEIEEITYKKVLF
jgi:hypothetical protein